LSGISAMCSTQVYAAEEFINMIVIVCKKTTFSER
jgi:hypothetical protein